MTSRRCVACGAPLRDADAARLCGSHICVKTRRRRLQHGAKLVRQALAVLAAGGPADRAATAEALALLRAADAKFHGAGLQAFRRSITPARRYDGASARISAEPEGSTGRVRANTTSPENPKVPGRRSVTQIRRVSGVAVVADA
jgi:hypothetical protein